MDFSNNLFSFSFPAWSFVAAGFLLSLIITWRAIPTIVTIAHQKELNGKPNGRSSHKNSTPLLGGMAVFAGFILSTVVIAGVGFVHELKYIIAGLIILLFIGLKDDILVIDPKKKLMAEIFASLIIIVLGDIRIENFHHFAGIDGISYIASIIFTLFVFIVIINGFNLIDGIDGLASGVGIITSLTFGIWFWIAGHIPYVVLCFSLTGSLIGFFRFNVFSKKNKIFLGDNGSMIIGLAMAVITVRFLQYEVNASGLAVIPSAASVAFCVMIVPLFDTLRVFTLRVVNGKSPFKADLQHIHHKLLDLGNSHLKATLIILSANILFIIIAVLFSGAGDVILLTLEIGLATVLSYILVYLVRKRKTKPKLGL